MRVPNFDLKQCELHATTYITQPDWPFRDRGLFMNYICNNLARVVAHELVERHLPIIEEESQDPVAPIVYRMDLHVFTDKQLAEFVEQIIQRDRERRVFMEEKPAVK